jgi:arsenate reductase
MLKTKVLFLCTHNSARSQMAEAILRKYGGNRFEVCSAGLEPGGIHPATRLVMEEVGLDLAGQYSKDVLEYLGREHFGYLVTVCSRAEELCPTVFPSIGQRLHWPFDDPAGPQAEGEDEVTRFRRVRDEIDEKIRAWLAELGREPDMP